MSMHDSWDLVVYILVPVIHPYLYLFDDDDTCCCPTWERETNWDFDPNGHRLSFTGPCRLNDRIIRVLVFLFSWLLTSHLFLPCPCHQLVCFASREAITSSSTWMSSTKVCVDPPYYYDLISFYYGQYRSWQTFAFGPDFFFYFTVHFFICRLPDKFAYGKMRDGNQCKSNFLVPSGPTWEIRADYIQDFYRDWSFWRGE